MERIAWDEKYKIGVQEVDEAHEKLFRIVHRLFDLAEDANTNLSAYGEGIKYLEAYAMTHFIEEEAYMRSIRYSDFAQHKRTHDSFRDKTLPSLKRDLELSGYSQLAVQRFAGTLNSWLAEHILREDQAIVGKAVARKGPDLSAQVTAISKAVNLATQDIFQVEAKLSDAEYKGQNIGNGFYASQCYDIEGKIRLQILLGVEDVIMSRGVNRTLKWKRKTEIAAIDTQPVFRQLFVKLAKVFQGVDVDAPVKDSLLTRDEFRAEFMKGYPCSLLFDTKLGAFVFCYRSWRV
ncbi:MAG: hemerythrin family protein [Lachnospiraceae bacterium]|nr:hemerythrin family protein [Lachnospiraceae bacterium]